MREHAAQIDLLLEYLGCLRRGEKVDRAGFLARCPRSKREELALVMDAADELETVARELRAYLSPEAAKRALSALRRRLRVAGRSEERAASHWAGKGAPGSQG